jgi:hypothetical protein
MPHELEFNNNGFAKANVPKNAKTQGLTQSQTLSRKIPQGCRTISLCGNYFKC